MPRYLFCFLQTILVEPTTGKHRTWYCFCGSSHGIQTHSHMPASINLERRILLCAFGAEIVLNDPEKGLKGAVDKAEEIILNTPNAYMFQQFDNMANTKIHFDSTGPEIWKDTLGCVDILVAGIGTSGTITGTGPFLKMMIKEIRVVGVEPAERSVISGENQGGSILHWNLVLSTLNANAVFTEVYSFYHSFLRLVMLLSRLCAKHHGW